MRFISHYAIAGYQSNGLSGMSTLNVSYIVGVEQISSLLLQYTVSIL
jgi:hypothetical protein